EASIGRAVITTSPISHGARKTWAAAVWRRRPRPLPAPTGAGGGSGAATCAGGALLARVMAASARSPLDAAGDLVDHRGRALGDGRAAQGDLLEHPHHDLAPGVRSGRGLVARAAVHLAVDSDDVEHRGLVLGGELPVLLGDARVDRGAHGQTRQLLRLDVRGAEGQHLSGEGRLLLAGLLVDRHPGEVEELVALLRLRRD